MQNMRLLSLFLIFISQWIFSASDEGNITVNGETVNVSPEGEVVDPYVVETDQPGYFERAVMRTIRRWAYEPYVYNGVPVTVNDVTARFTFKLTD